MLKLSGKQESGGETGVLVDGSSLKKAGWFVGMATLLGGLAGESPEVAGMLAGDGLSSSRNTKPTVNPTAKTVTTNPRKQNQRVVCDFSFVSSVMMEE
jgi:hypothetical protein